MSGTRIAKPGSRPRQERFASSFDRGLLANLVAKRCAVIESQEQREMIWFLQWLSWLPGGLGDVPAPNIGTWCLDPKATLAEEQFEKLRAFRAGWIAAVSGSYIETSIGRRISGALDYTRSARTISIIDGPSRIGKTFAVRHYCLSSAGLVRYAQVPSSSDEQSFLRAIAASLGVSINLNSKAVELRARVEEVLQGGDLTLCLDEAAYLFSQTWQRYAQPARVNWIMTALANSRVPVALISCPHFYTNQSRTEKLTGWNSAQFIGRIGHVERLPDALPREDLMDVAGAVLPQGSRRMHLKLAVYAEVSKKHLASIEAVATRARWLAQKQGRDAVTEADIDTALNESVIPSDSALAVSLRQAFRTRPAEVSPERRGVIPEGFAAAGSRLPALSVT